MNGLLSRLEKIQRECGDDGANKTKGKKEDQDLDEFTRVKKKAAFELEIRRLIKEREQLEQEAPGTIATVEVSSKIRNLMKEARTDAVALDNMQKKDKADYIKKNKTIPEKEELLEKREEIVQLVIDHIEECKLLDQKRHGTSAFSSQSSSKQNDITELPDIDDPAFQVLIKNDKIIDGLLDNVAAGVEDLRQQAIAMGQAAQQQDKALDDLDKHVDKVNAQLENINVRLARALKSTRKADRFIVDIILLCVLLGLIGYIYSVVKG